jgi:hypothetical protein
MLGGSWSKICKNDLKLFIKLLHVYPFVMNVAIFYGGLVGWKSMHICGKDRCQLKTCWYLGILWLHLCCHWAGWISLMCFWEINVGLIWILGVALENKSVFGQIGQRREWGWGEAVEPFFWGEGSKEAIGGGGEKERKNLKVMWCAIWWLCLPHQQFYL